MKAKINKLLCRLFGHKNYEEVYAQRCDRLFGYRVPRSKYYYVVIKRTYCERCGLVHKEVMSQPMRRSQLLQRGWFVER